MDDNEKFEQFLEKVLKRPLPQNPMARVRTLAKELAEGAAEKIWSVQIEILPLKEDELYVPKSTELQNYLDRRWGEKALDSALLHSNGYLEGHKLVKLAFDLLSEAESPSIFISYRRKDSSAFAMFVLTRLKVEGLEAFVDMSLRPGENWHAGLEERIKEYDYLIALIGNETLKSDVCLKEFGWAIEAGLSVIPVWHNGFKYRSGGWDIPAEIDRALSSTHSIEVKEESASGYNTAIVELLNVFGITP